MRQIYVILQKLFALEKIPLSLELSTLFPPLLVRSIRLVIALLHPSDQRQDLCNGIRAQG